MNKRYIKVALENFYLDEFALLGKVGFFISKEIQLLEWEGKPNFNDSNCNNFFTALRQVWFGNFRNS